MGSPEPARVDTAALRDAARAYQCAAERIEHTVRSELSALRFHGATAGIAHTARGDALRHRIEQVVQRLCQWSMSASGISAALQRTADRYADTESRAAHRIGEL
ncbi:hypothetical protein MHAS_00332 [Mycolicibacterium hassiacum DSM 44199]|jgi:hypothetical protein|uniref:type VII secretion target n=1 Tax=Mycolicibacterium hassiacum TaxID=46351 RepID=UPI0002D75DFA|nr:type VII secretion target [Mycolicibacterium hassiacum]MBX5488362.1 ESX-1 secretion-associated protein [Mycolicibacterium hassiacum]MDA4087048.1 hypothetical protein [Mycolicibacterium hassiacum DSM 44199]VCT88648.1 hypothetical protein MHAS_00332 [Mycolicibacterium hassiacum DSM 44199]